MQCERQGVDYDAMMKGAQAFLPVEHQIQQHPIVPNPNQVCSSYSKNGYTVTLQTRTIPSCPGMISYMCFTCENVDVIFVQCMFIPANVDLPLRF